MRKIGLISLALAASLLPSTMFAGRLDGVFGTQEEGQAADTNDACLVMSGPFNGASGLVTGISGGCTVEIAWFAFEPHKSSATALKTGKTEGSAKTSQSIFTDVRIFVFDTDGVAGVDCSIANGVETLEGSVNEDVEKCKASNSIKGTDVADPGDDTVQSGNASVSCELGEAGANIDVDPETAGVQPPSQAAIDVVVGAFDGRKDVKLDNKGKLTIKHKGVPDTGDEICGF